MEIYYCGNCKTWITADQIESKVVFRQTLEEPEEREEYCGICKGSAEDFEDMDISESELCEILNDLEYVM